MKLIKIRVLHHWARASVMGKLSRAGIIASSHRTPKHMVKPLYIHDPKKDIEEILMRNILDGEVEIKCFIEKQAE